MRKATLATGAFAAVLGLLTVVMGLRTQPEGLDGAAATSSGGAPAAADAATGLLYGVVTTEGGDVYEGRLRFGDDEEGLWGNYFNGYKDENPWLAHAPIERLPRERLSWTVFGTTLAVESRPALGRPFMARFGDIARI